jgi:hypothetical protein
VDLIAWLDQHAGSAQAGLAFVLVVVTAYYAYVTRRIADGTRAMAEATRRSVEQAQQQRYDAVRPAIVLGLLPRDSDWAPALQRFGLRVHNVGVGPAFDVRIHPYDGADYEQKPYVSEPTPVPVALPAGRFVDIDFTAAETEGSARMLESVRAGAWAGGLLASYRDAYANGLTTRVHLEGTDLVNMHQTRGIRISSQSFNP